MTKKKILIIDDSSSNRFLLKEMLKEDFDILEAENGEEGLACIHENGSQISLVLLDIVMPGMSGIDVLKVMNEEKWMLESFPVIVISSDHNRRTLDEAFSLGISDYLLRPFNTLLVKKRVITTIQYFEEIHMKENRIRLLEYAQSKADFYTSITNDILFEYSTERDELLISEQGVSIFGLQRSYLHPLSNKSLKECISEEDIKQFVDGVKKLKNDDDRMRMDVMLKGKGHHAWYRLICKKIHVPSSYEGFGGMIGVATNINDEHEQMLQLQEQAYLDSLTGILNRGTLEKRIQNHLDHMDENDECILMILDVDNLKTINDTYGHSYGDAYLKLCAKQMLQNTRTTDLVGRIGGDEFMLLLDNFKHTTNLPEKVFHRILDIQNMEVSWMEKEDQKKLFSLSGGYIVIHKGKHDYQTLYQKADTALYEAKHSGKSKILAYPIQK